MSIKEAAKLPAVGGVVGGCQEILDMGGKSGLCFGEVGKDVVNVFRRGRWFDGGGAWRVFSGREVVWFAAPSVLVVAPIMMGKTSRRVRSSDSPASGGGTFC